MRYRWLPKTWIFTVLFYTGSAAGFSLTDSVEHVLKTNPEILAARHEYASRKHEVEQAQAGYLPNVKFTAGVGEESREAPATGNEEVSLTRTELGIEARQLIFDGFATSSEVSRQKSRVESAEFGTFASAEDLALRTAEVYLAVLRQAELLDLANQSLREHQNIYDQMKLRSETGVGSKADLDQIAARLALANSNVIVAQSNLADSRSNFHRLTGFFPNLDSMSRPDISGVLPADLETAIEDALEAHPTLRSAGADVDAANAQYEASGSRFWP